MGPIKTTALAGKTIENSGMVGDTLCEIRTAVNIFLKKGVTFSPVNSLSLIEGYILQTGY